ncbi:MAG: hypothetical protein RMK20_11040 [Verrucomicrobiales bacterium]|nr:hypothetical protein [Verrucomicrobiales bacterium]
MKPLLAAADEFLRQAPWRWMSDSQVIGLKHPQTGEVLLCSVLGNLGQLYALQVYRREAGHRWLLTTVADDVQGEPWAWFQEKGFEADLIEVEFTTRADLWREDRAALTAAAYSPIRKRGHVWPLFRSILPGYLPWPVNAEEARTLLFALPRALAVARLAQACPNLWDDHPPGEVAFVPEDFDPAGDALRPEDINWHPLLPPAEPMPAPVTLSEGKLRRFAALPQAQGFQLELDTFYLPRALTGPERPWFPTVALAVDRASGLVVSFKISEQLTTDPSPMLASVLSKALDYLRHRPESLHVRRSRVARMLEPVAAQLDIPVRLEPELPALNEACAGLEQMLGF